MALLASTALASAGGLDRNTLGTGFLFESGTYVELGYTVVSPDVSGVLTAGPIGSGDITPSFGYATLSYTQQINDQLTFGLVVDAPYGADVAYPAGGSYPFRESQAQVRTQQITAAIRYEFTENISAYAGLRAMRGQANDVYVSVAAPALATTRFSYRLDAESDWAFGYMVGAAYEIPDIALRVALTYFSEVELSMSGSQGAVTGAGAALAARAGIATSVANFNVTMPQSVLLEAQSGVAAGTLVFGSVRWTNWDGFAIIPGNYPAPGGALVSYTNDVWTWNLGVGRQINDDLAMSASITYEAELDGFQGQLGPTDGRLSLGIGAEYAVTDSMSIAGGVQYIMIGDAQTEAGTSGTALANFNDNDAIAAGIRISFQF